MVRSTPDAHDRDVTEIKGDRDVILRAYPGWVRGACGHVHSADYADLEDWPWPEMYRAWPRLWRVVGACWAQEATDGGGNVVTLEPGVHLRLDVNETQFEPTWFGGQVHVGNR